MEGLIALSSYAFYECSSLRHVVIPSTLKTAGIDIFWGCTMIEYVKWNSTLINVPRLNPQWYNPNMLLYVPEGVSVDKSNWNIIAGGKAEKIVLTQSCSFYCPEAFTANEVVFEHNFGTDIWRSVATGNGEAARWNTLVLPFTVTSIASENKGALSPFGTDEVTNEKAKPFWLCEMTADGWKDAVKIEANKPYIYAMPNNPNYLDSYNIQDLVTFSAKNVTIEKTPDELTSSPVGPDGWALTPTYAYVSQQANFFNMNWSSFRDKKNVTHPVGNCFRQDVRATNAFEAYIKPAANTRAEYISLGGKATTRGTRQLGQVPQREDMPLW